MLFVLRWLLVLLEATLMARRKPKNVNRPTGIVDDIVDGIRDIVSPWLGTPPGQNSRLRRRKGWLVVLPRLWIKRSRVVWLKLVCKAIKALAKAGCDQCGGFRYRLYCWQGCKN
jgi:hypothetical protein